MPGKAPRKEPSQTVWDLEELRDILDLLSERGIIEFEVEKNGFRIRVKRGTASEVTHTADAAVHQEIARVVPRAPKAAPLGAVRDASEPLAQAPAKLHVIKSPIVGTFYASPAPDAAPFVKVGDEVKAGQVLCVIEAMKLMNEIETDTAGRVAQIFVENEQPVEYGEPLFGLIPSNAQ